MTAEPCTTLTHDASSAAVRAGAGPPLPASAAQIGGFSPLAEEGDEHAAEKQTARGAAADVKAPPEGGAVEPEIIRSGAKTGPPTQNGRGEHKP